MRRIDIAGLSAIFVLLISGFAAGQSLNIDFGSGRGSPDDRYAAAGLPGVWNVIESPLQFPPEPIGPIALLGLDGRPTAVTLLAHPAAGTLPNIPLPHDNLGMHHPLLGDGLLGSNGPEIPINFTIDGLENGTYRVLVYTWYWPASAFAQGVLLTEPEFLYYLPVGGPWQGDLAIGVTHMNHIAHVTNNRIEFFAVGDGPGSFFNGDIYLNGIQLWKIAPSSEDPAPFCASLDTDNQCMSAHDGRGCNDVTCCTAVCQYDPYCCNNQWDHLCAGIANTSIVCEGGIHPNCLGHDLATDCFESNIYPGCSDPECCDKVYQVAPGCAQFVWDEACVQLAELFCVEEPPGCGHPASQSCFQVVNPPTVTPYCEDAECCEAVCSLDSFCCDISWDFICAHLAHRTCEGGACCNGEGSCFEGHPWGGCDDPDCCSLVCADFPPCCMDPQPQTNFGWTNICVNKAIELCNPNPPPPGADLDGDGNVGVPDLLILLEAWGECPPGCNCPPDFNSDGSVGVPDLLHLLAQWG